MRAFLSINYNELCILFVLYIIYCTARYYGDFARFCTKMETVDLFARKEGTIWVRRTILRSDGLVLKACNTEKGMTTAGKKLSFMKVAFSPLGDVFYTADHMGNIYKFDLAKNRYVI